MNSKIYYLLFGFGLLFSSCADNSKKEADLIKKERELLEKEKTILKKEGEVLKANQKKEAENQIKQEQAVRENNSYSVEDIVGFWFVTMNCTVSDCRKNKPGDIRTEIWQINQSNGKIIAKVSNSDTKIREYEGTFSGNTLNLKATRTGFASGKATIKISLQSKDEMSGDREVLNGSSSDVCKIEYFIKAKRQ